MKTLVAWIFVVAVAGVTVAEVIENEPCDSGRDANILSEVSEISVNPCAEAANGEPCVLTTGSTAQIVIKFKPSEQPRRLKSTLAWVNGDSDLHFSGMRPNACLYMSCPPKANEENVFNATLTLSGSLPPGLYPLKAKLQEQTGRKRVFACNLFTINLVSSSESTTSSSN